MTINIFQLNTPTLDLPQLHDRTLDLAIVGSHVPRLAHPTGKDLTIESLFDDDLVVAIGINNP